MKKIFVFLLVLCSTITTYAQNDTTKYTNVFGYGNNFNRIKAKLAIVFPSDTTANKLPGCIAVLNDTAYVKTATAWVKVSSPDLSGYVTIATDQTITGVKTFNPTLTPTGKLARSALIAGILTASADTDTLVGLDVMPVFDTAGRFGVKRYWVRIGGTYDNVSPVLLKLKNNGVGSNTGAAIEFPWRQRIEATFGRNGFIFYNKDTVSYFEADAAGITWNGSTALTVNGNNSELTITVPTGTSSKIFYRTGGYHSFVNYNSGTAAFEESVRINSTQLTAYKLAGYNSNMGSSYTVRSFTDKNYVDSADALRLPITDTAAMLSAYPLINGTRATGTWNISVTGNAATATTATNATNVDVLNASSGVAGVALTGSLATGNQRIYYNGSLTYNVASGILNTPSISTTSILVDSINIRTSTYVTLGEGIRLSSNKFLYQRTNSQANFFVLGRDANTDSLYVGALTGGTILSGSKITFKTFGSTGGIISLPQNTSGVVALASDLSGYLPLTGGTLTGALSGTSGTFTGDFSASTSSGSVIIGTGAANTLGTGGTIKLLNVHGGSGNGVLALSSSGTANTDVMGQIGFGSTGLSSSEKRTALIYSTKTDASTTTATGDLRLGTFNAGSYSDKIIITASGRVLFGTTTDDGSSIGQFNGNVLVNGASDPTLKVGSGAASQNAYIQLNAGTGANAYINSIGSGNLILGANGAASNHLSIASTGAATFSSTLGINGVADNVKGTTYTPTFSNQSNIDAITLRDANYIRVGNIVYVSALIDVDPTVAGSVSFEMTLPVSSNLTTYTLHGLGSTSNFKSGVVYANATTDNALCNIDPSTTILTGIYVQFSYTVQ